MIAGPVHAVSCMMQAMAAGNFQSLRSLRRRDEFRRLEDGVFAVADAWRRTAREDAELVERLADALRSRTGGDGSDPATEALLGAADDRTRALAERFGQE